MYCTGGCGRVKAKAPMYGDLAMGAGPSAVSEGCLKGSCDSSCTKQGTGVWSWLAGSPPDSDGVEG
jgi:hypothetical protein